MNRIILIALAGAALTACQAEPKQNTAVSVSPLGVQVRAEEPEVSKPTAVAEDTRFCADETTIDSYAKSRGFEPSDTDVGPGIVTYENDVKEQMQFSYVNESEVCLLTR